MEYLDDFTPTAMDARPTSPGALAKLKDALSGYDRNRPWERMLHMLRSVAVYQFGRGGEKLIPEDCRVTGRYHKKVLNSDGTEICTLMMDRGLFSLALEGGRILGDLNLKWVEIDFKLETGTLFAPGVSDADPDIIPGDEVVIMYSGDAVGVGRAVLSGEEMLRAGRGVAVRVRRRKKT
jgi:archaeosine synthase